jgi:pimeloyl-ACP methyl ester carboxylesterase
MKKITLPTLIVTGDEDDPCIEPGVLMKRTIASSALVVIPQAGHTINIEDPEAFNRAVSEFLALVDAGSWMPRDPRSMPGQGILGFTKK